MPLDEDKLTESLKTLLSWDFEHLIMAHGDPIRRDAKSVIRHADRRYLNG